MHHSTVSAAVLQYTSLYSIHALSYLYISHISQHLHLISAILHALSRLCEHAHKRTQARVIAWVVLCAQLLELDASREILGPACARLTEDALAATRRDAMQTEALDPVACAQRLASQQFLQD